MAKYKIGDIFIGDFPVTQYYGERAAFYKQFGLAGHEGVDWGTPNGTPVIAPFDGIILRDTFDDKDYGNFTIVWDSVQLCAVWFCHLQDLSTQLGQHVKKGDLLGHSNNTGNSSGPHLHVNFVETNNLGVRLNQNNGYQGFLNILDKNLVQWDTGAQIQQPPAPAQEVITDQTKLDIGDPFGILEFQAVRSILKDQKNQITSLTGQRDDYQKTNNIQANKLSDLYSENASLKQAVKDAQAAGVSNADASFLKSFKAWVMSLFSQKPS